MTPARGAKPVTHPVQASTTRKRRAVRTADCVVAYVRVSTEEQADTGASLAAQVEAVERYCAANALSLAAVYSDTASGSLPVAERPGLSDALEHLDRCDAGSLIVARLDRLSRDTATNAALLNRAKRDGWTVVALDLGMDTSTLAGRMVAEVLGAVAQYERGAIAERTRAGLAAKRAQGVRLGRPSALPLDVRARVLAERQAGASLRTVAAGLNGDGIATPTGSGVWTPPTVARAERTARLDRQAEEAQADVRVKAPVT